MPICETPRPQAGPSPNGIFIYTVPLDPAYPPTLGGIGHVPDPFPEMTYIDHLRQKVMSLRPVKRSPL
jgi:hypothetical protein